MGSEKIVLKRADMDEYDERMMRLKRENKRLRTRLKAEIGDEEEEHPDERLEWEEFQVQLAGNNRYVWLELPSELWIRLGLKGGEWVRCKIALIPELNEEEKRALGNAKMEVFLKAVSQSTAKI